MPVCVRVLGMKHGIVPDADENKQTGGGAVEKLPKRRRGTHREKYEK